MKDRIRDYSIKTIIISLLLKAVILLSICFLWLKADLTFVICLWVFFSTSEMVELIHRYDTRKK